MTKIGFLLSLRDKLSRLPEQDVEERLRFYSEMIEDRMEEGLSEEEAVAAVGSVEAIAAQILAELPAKPPLPKKRLQVWEIVLLILGSPVWLSLLIAAAAVVFSLYISLWAVIISLWAVFGSLVACAFAGIAAGIGFTFGSHRLTGITIIGAGLVCAGLSIFLFYGCKAATKATVLLPKLTVLWIKNRSARKENV